MMKKKIDIHTLMITLLWVLAIPQLTSCGEYDDDIEALAPPNSEWNSGYNNAFIHVATASFATILQPENVVDNNGITTLATMEDDKMGLVYLDNPEILKAVDANHSGQRILYNYSKMTTNKENDIPIVRITQLMKVLTKGIDFPQTGEEAEYGRDGIHLIAGTPSKEHLTFQFQIQTAGGEHRFSLLAKEGSKPDAAGYLTLEFRHLNESGMEKFLSQPNYASFLMTDAPGFADGTLKGFRIHYIDLNNQTQTLNIEIQ